MAERDYVRFAAACPTCNSEFTAKKPDHKFCSLGCRLRSQHHPVDATATRSCQRCGEEYQAKPWKESLYCSTACKVAAWRADNPERHRAHESRRKPKPPSIPVLCAYIAKHCGGCGLAWGARRTWDQCPACITKTRNDAAREAARATGEAKHKAAGRVVECDECAIQFCPLYGASLTKLCACCRRDRDKAQKDRRDERIKSGPREPVNRTRVFERCGWLCQLCGIATPKELRGTNEHNAPELDHIEPLAKGGAHTYSNTQLLCRSCNGWKGARGMREALEALAA